jgi:hypothetical protein
MVSPPGSRPMHTLGAGQLLAQEAHASPKICAGARPSGLMM